MLTGTRRARAAGRWVPDITSFDKTLGAAQAPVTIIEYASFTCPHCANFHNTVLPSLKKQYVETGKVRLVFRDFPLGGLALRASILARWVPDERYFAFVDTLFQTQQNWAHADDPVRALGRIGRLAGLSQDDIDGCLNDKTLANEILAARREGAQKYGVDATPSFIVGGRKLSGEQTLGDLTTVIEPLLGAS